MRPLHHQVALATACALAALSLSACRDTTTESVGEHRHAANPAVTGSVNGSVASDVARLRNLVAPLHQLSAANAAGFDTPLSPCFASPEGGMGFHWGNVVLIDGTVQWDQPEVLVFAPGPDESDGVKLAAVEYLVPIGLSLDPPVLFGQTFVPGGPGNSLWTLHVWTGIENPSGLFAPWNPKVSCPA